MGKKREAEEPEVARSSSSSFNALTKRARYSSESAEQVGGSASARTIHVRCYPVLNTATMCGAGRTRRLQALGTNP
jgi:hypothetical protein